MTASGNEGDRLSRATLLPLAIYLTSNMAADRRDWYETLLNKKPDFIPHGGFAEWELIPGCRLQVAEGIPAEGSGPLRLGVTDIESGRERIIKELSIDTFEIFSREEVPARRATFADPWGNHVGFFEDLNEKGKNKRVREILGR